MPVDSPFPLAIQEKINLPELVAFFAQFGEQFYLSAEDINLMIQGMQYLYENIDPTSNPNLLELGETATTAYRGDRGKTAYDFATNNANVFSNAVNDLITSLKVILALGYTPLSPLNNLSEVNKATARVNLEIDKKTTPGNANYTILSTDKVISTSIALTANRTWIAPTSLPAGKEILITDEAGVIGTYNIIIAVPTGKKLNGVVNGTETIRAAFGWRRLLADGNDNFTFDAGIQRVLQNKTISSSTYTLLDADTNFFLIFSGACVVTVPAGLTALQFQGLQNGFNTPVSFVAASGVTIYRSATENLQTADQFSTFGIRFLYGTSPQVYSLFGRLQQI